MATSYRGVVTRVNDTLHTAHVELPYLAPGQEMGPMQSCVSGLIAGDTVVVVSEDEGASDDYVLVGRTNPPVVPGNANSGLLGGGNLVPNPSFGDGLTGYSAASNGTLALDSLNGIFGAECGKITRDVSAGTGTISCITDHIPVKPALLYSVSGWVRLGNLGATEAKIATLTVHWYNSSDTLLGSFTSGNFSESIQGTWLQTYLSGVLSPDTVSYAVAELSVAGVPESEYHLFDGFQLEPGQLFTSFNSNFGDSTLTGNMLVPATVTARETAEGSAKPYADVAANRPAAGTAGRLYVATDTNELSYDTGSTWISVGGNVPPSAGSDAYGWNGWSYDHVACGTSGTVCTLQAIKVVKVVVPTATPILGVTVHVLTAAAAPANCYVALLDDTGTQVAISNDVSSTVGTTTGPKKLAFTSSYTPTPGVYYVVLLFGGTTAPALARAPLGSTTLWNQSIASAPYRFNSGATGQSSIPSITLSSLTASSDAFWVGLNTA